MYDSLKILGLGLGAAEREVELEYQRLASTYHPNKWKHSLHTTRMKLAETTAHFQLLSNSQSFQSLQLLRLLHTPSDIAPSPKNPSQFPEKLITPAYSMTIRLD